MTLSAILAILRAAGTILLTSVPLVLLWNNVLVDAVSVVKPISFYQAVGIQILAVLLQQSLNVYYIVGRPKDAQEHA